MPSWFGRKSHLGASTSSSADKRRSKSNERAASQARGLSPAPLGQYIPSAPGSADQHPQQQLAYPPAYQAVQPKDEGAAASYYDYVENPSFVASSPGPPYLLLNPESFPLPTANPTMPLADDPYSFLAEFDTVFLIDDSGSMSGKRWAETRKALESIIPITTYYDKDGVDLYFLNYPDDPSHMGIDNPKKVMQIFTRVTPRHATPTGRRLNEILKPYLARFAANPKSVKPLNIIVITDGVPTDDVESVIVQSAKKLDKLEADFTQVGIQFFQVGNDASAAEALKELDDILGELHNIRDMVDTVPWKGKLEGDWMLKVVLGAVNRRLDRKKT